MTAQRSIHSCSLIISAYNQAAQMRLVLDSVLAQTVAPGELIVADDGSSDDLPEVIAAFRRRAGGLPILLLSQPDRGFRKHVIVNEAIRRTRSGYVIAVDGDMVLHRRFVENHLRYRDPRRVLCGYRGVKLGRAFTDDLLTGRRRLDDSFCGLLRHLARGDLEHAIRGVELHRTLVRRLLLPRRLGEWPTAEYLSGGNFSVDVDGLIAVNGYDETIGAYGYEDWELGVRLQRSGLHFANVSSSCITYHLWHPSSPRVHPRVKHRVRALTSLRCRYGLQALTEGSTVDDFEPLEEREAHPRHHWSSARPAPLPERPSG
jgi:glycosyltransferase involved in cell wall biosynthesis